MPSRLERWAAGLWPTRKGAVLAAVLLTLPTLAGGWLLDDWIHRAAILGLVPHHGGGLLELFTFADGDPRPSLSRSQLGYPWWSLPELKLSFLRPLASLTHQLDHMALGARPWLHHLHSVAWYAACAAAVGLLLARVLPVATAGLAALLWAIDDAHALPVGWIANRNALVAALPALLGLWAHLRGRQDGWRPGVPLGALGLALGLLGGESAVGAFGLLAAWELTQGPGTTRDKLRSLLPAVGVLVAYALVYKGLGYGARGSGAYLDPVAEPLSFLWHALQRVPVLAAALLVPLPVEVASLLPAWRLPFWLAAVAVLITGTWLMRQVYPRLPPAEQGAVRFLLLGALLAMVPLAATLPSLRLTTLASVASAGLLAVVLRALSQNLADVPRELQGRLAAVRRTLWAVHAGLAPLLLFASGFLGLWVAPQIEALQQAPALATAAGRTVILAAAPDPVVGFYPGMLLKSAGGPSPQAWWCLAMATGDVAVQRIAPRVLEVRSLGAPFVSTSAEQLVRDPKHVFRPGQRVRQPGFQVEVVEVADGFPSILRFHLDKDLDDQEYAWLKWQDGRMVGWRPPPQGQREVMVHQAGLFGF